MAQFGTEVRIKDDGGVPTPDPMELFVLNRGRHEMQPTVLRFINSTEKTVHVVLADEGILDDKEFFVAKENAVRIAMKKDCPQGKHSYSVHYPDGVPVNEEPKIIVDPDTPS